MLGAAGTFFDHDPEARKMTKWDQIPDMTKLLDSPILNHPTVDVF